MTPTLSGVSSPSRKEHSVAAMQNSPRGTRVLKARRICAIVAGTYLAKRSVSFCARAALTSSSIEAGSSAVRDSIQLLT